MVCPTCRSALCRRSKRKGVGDHFWGLLGLRPWRCRTCEARFYAWLVPASCVVYVHCPRCGNLDLQRKPKAAGEGWAMGLLRLVHVRAYRCDPCQYRFFSFLAFRRIVPTRTESLPSR